MSYYKRKCGGIYIIEIDNYYYIGKSTNVWERWSSHYTNLKLNKHSSTKLQKKFNEFGVEKMSFRVIEYISITEFSLKNKLIGKSLKSAYNKFLLFKEKEWMKKYSINYSLNKINRYFG